MPREIIIMVCTECKRRNYTTKKNRRVMPGRFEIKKFCPRCNASTVHKETR